MEILNYIDYIQYGSIFTAGIGASVLVRSACTNISDWLKRRKENRFFSKQQLEAYEKQWEEYTKGLKTKITNLESDLCDAMGRQLALVDERNVLAGRCKIMAQEISCDPDKKTRVLSR